MPSLPAASVTLNSIELLPDSVAPSQLIAVPLALLVTSVQVVPPSTEPYRISPTASGALSVPVMVCAAVLVRKSVALVPVSGLTGQLPTLNQLNSASPGQLYTAVGYGTVRNDKTKGPASLFFDGERRWVDGTMNSLNKAWLRLSENPSTGNGGTCYGDSGGPHFFKGTRVLSSITVTGDKWCRSTDVTYRVDTASARAFLGQYVSLP